MACGDDEFQWQRQSRVEIGIEWMIFVSVFLSRVDSENNRESECHVNKWKDERIRVVGHKPCPYLNFRYTSASHILQDGIGEDDEKKKENKTVAQDEQYLLQ